MTGPGLGLPVPGAGPDRRRLAPEEFHHGLPLGPVGVTIQRVADVPVDALVDGFDDPGAVVGRLVRAFGQDLLEGQGRGRLGPGAPGPGQRYVQSPVCAVGGFRGEWRSRWGRTRAAAAVICGNPNDHGEFPSIRA